MRMALRLRRSENPAMPPSAALKPLFVFDMFDAGLTSPSLAVSKTTNFYDKAAALGDEQAARLDGAQRDYLARHLRLDITLHPPAIGRSLTAARLPRGQLTAAAWCRALENFPGGEAGFRDWLLRDALVETLRLPAVADFRPGLLERARARLSRRPRLMAVWEDWLAGRGELRELLAAADAKAPPRCARKSTPCGKPASTPTSPRLSCTAWP